MNQVDKWFTMPCWIIDILPKRVPGENSGQFFAVEKYFLQDPTLRRKQLNMILKLNCYYDLTVADEHEETRNPMPAVWERKIGRESLNLIIGGRALMTADHTDIHMTVFAEDEEILAMIRKLAASEGLFVWKGND